MANPLQSLIPKDPEAGSDPNGLRGAAEGWQNAQKALHPESPAPPNASKAPVASPARPLGPRDRVPQTPYGTGEGAKRGEKRIDTSFPGTPMPKMHSGGTVPKTGPYTLKAGEKVLTPEQHGQLKSAMSLASSALSHNPAKDAEPEIPKILKSMTVKELHTGGFHVQKHDGKGGMTEHGAPDNDSVVEHFMDHMAHPDEDEEAAEAGDHDMSAAETMSHDLGGK